MSGWTQKRFWKEALAVPAGDGFAVQLDGRPLKTPAKAPLRVPGRTLAQAIADEWNAQENVVDPLSMPFTRSANSAIDKVTPQHTEVATLVAEYGASDLLCYRAAFPEGLVARQSALWDPLLHWADKTLGAPLLTTAGIRHQPQPESSLARLQARVFAQDPFALTALHDLVALSGSLIIGFAALEGYDDAAALWRASRVDEDWQTEQWGHDDDAAATAERKAQDFAHALRFYHASK